MRVLAGLSALAEIVVLALAFGAHHHAPLDLVAAIVLAPLATAAAVRMGGAVAGERLGVAAGAVYAVLPLLGTAFALGDYRHTFLHAQAPQIVGLRSPWLLAIGFAAAVVALYAPPRLSAILGVASVVVALALWGVHPLGGLRNGLHETAWSIAFGAWVFVAGVAGVARRSTWLAAASGGWVAAVVLYGAHLGYDRFWGSLAAAAPEAAVLISSVALLGPRLRPRSAPANAR
jgi:hypothetical protein